MLIELGLFVKKIKILLFEIVLENLSKLNIGKLLIFLFMFLEFGSIKPLIL